MNSQFARNLSRQLRYWGCHCAINALPSFIMALAYMGLYKSPTAITAMLCAIVTFIVIYAIATSLSSPLTNQDHILSKSMRLGAKIRSWIAAISVPLTGTPLLFFVPDLWLGMAACRITNFVYGQGILGSYSEIKSFSQVYLTTMLEGLMISMLLLMIAFFSLLIIQSKARKKV